MHTKGPWEATGTKALGLREVVAPNADFSEGHLVAVVEHYFYRDGKRTKLPREQVEANARLIAAAPDLLFVLRELLDYEQSPAAAGAVEMAKAAILKAEGKS
jgi:hypothetical protein